MRTVAELVGYAFWYGVMLVWLGVVFSVVAACVAAPVALGVKLWRVVQAPAPPPPPHSVSIAEPFAVRSAL